MCPVSLSKLSESAEHKSITPRGKKAQAKTKYVRLVELDSRQLDPTR